MIEPGFWDVAGASYGVEWTNAIRSVWIESIED